MGDVGTSDRPMAGMEVPAPSIVERNMGSPWWMFCTFFYIRAAAGS
jgi:hypothetical protein